MERLWGEMEDIEFAAGTCGGTNSGNSWKVTFR